MKKVISTFLFLLFLAGVACGVIFGSRYIFKPVPLVIQGEVDARQIDVAAKIVGRIEEIRVKEGDKVTKGQVLAVLKTPEVEAKAQQAAGVQQAATAQREKADAGARKQEIEAAYNAWQTAETMVDLGARTYKRLAALYEADSIPIQQLDEVTAKYQAALKMARAAKAVYEMANEGARVEDKKAARGIEQQAGGVVREVQSYLSEAEVKAPGNGEVVDIAADPGELITPGFPVISLVDLSDVWVVFNLREDLLSDIRVGSTFSAHFPGLGPQLVELRVDYIKALGDFATWRATKTSGDFDLKTFEVRARPVQPVEGLRPGMGAIVTWASAQSARK
jgi:HlyD family secretion protein